jgi:hypothetical protein
LRICRLSEMIVWEIRFHVKIAREACSDGAPCEILT